MGRVCLGKLGLWAVVIVLLIQVRGYNGCFEEERIGLLHLKQEFLNSDCPRPAHGDPLLPTWVEHPESIDCCRWERVVCDRTTGHVTELSLDNVRRISEDYWGIYNCPLNVSVFVPFKELRSLNLSFNNFGGMITDEDFKLLSKFNKLRHLDLSLNGFDKHVLRILSVLPSLKFFSLSGNGMGGSVSNQDLTYNQSNLEVLLLSSNRLEGNLPMEGLASFRYLETLDLSDNEFSGSIPPSIWALSSLKFLSLAQNRLDGSLPIQDLTYNQSNLEVLLLSSNNLNGSLPIEDLKQLSKFNKLRHLDLSDNFFNKHILRILGVLPSLKFFSLNGNGMGGSVSNQELTYNFSSLKALDLQWNSLSGTLPMEGLASFRHLKILDISNNEFSGSIPPSIQALSSLEVLSLASNKLDGSLPIQGLCELKKLEELDLSGNSFEGTLPPCLSNLRSLRSFDLSGNLFTGSLSSSLLGSLNSLEYIDLSHNRFEGLFSFSSFANHSKLEVVAIINDNVKFEVETEYTSWLPRFQLKLLALPNCNLNKASGQIPKFLLQQHKLRIVDLSQNKLNGFFPNWLLENNTGLEFFSLRRNYFVGMFHLLSYPSIHCFWMDVSDNHLSGQIQANLGEMLPYVENMNLSCNAFEGGIPSSFGQMSELQFLDLSTNDLSGGVPNELVRNCQNLKILILSNNRFNGPMLPADFNLTSILYLGLSNNKFTGSLTNVATKLTSLHFLDISNNQMSGMISMDKPIELRMLNLRNNSFNGKFPRALVPIEFMDVSYNSFSGSLDFCSDPNLGYPYHLHLQGNKFTGLIPKALLDSSSLLTLDIRDNNLFGTIPDFITADSELRILLLGGNQLSGLIPHQICRLNKISLMDLSNNSFTGSIPSCFSNIAFGKFETTDDAFTVYDGIPPIVAGMNKLEFNVVDEYSDLLSHFYYKEDEIEFVTKSKTNSYKGSILEFMSGLDLSCNKLSGKIPLELGNLSSIHALNLSHNYLTGPIPKTLSNLAQVESLDLSYNSLSGNIPSELTDLNFLSVFNVAHNNLSGRLPDRKAQFGTFEASSYEGNPFLCGPPLEKNCAGSPSVDSPGASSDETHDEEGKWYDIDPQIFSASFVSTYLVFLLGFAAVLYINPHWRRRWFFLIEEGLYSSYYFVVDALYKLFGFL